jgi:Na+/H+ antiporter NhaD/arsenite permease-like protein
VNRTTITVIGAGLLILFGQVSLVNISDFLDFNTLVLLFSMMILNANLRLAGFFKLTSAYLLRLTRKPGTFLLIEIIVVGVLSAFFLNDTICIMLTPFLLELLLAMDRNPIPYLIALATAANIGSTATLTGNPQNMIIGVASASVTRISSPRWPPLRYWAWVVSGSWSGCFTKRVCPDNYFPIPPSQRVHYYNRFY